MSQYWSATVHSLTPYVPGEQPKIDNLVKLNTNEHPLGPSPRVIEAIKNATNDSLRLYPDPNADALKAALATHHQVTPQQVFVGNAVKRHIAAFNLNFETHTRLSIGIPANKLTVRIIASGLAIP